jgi:hypothetical protein
VILSEPHEFIDFDATDIPAEVSEALREAITCHAKGCHVAAASGGDESSSLTEQGS